MEEVSPHAALIWPWMRRAVHRDGLLLVCLLPAELFFPRPAPGAQLYPSLQLHGGACGSGCWVASDLSARCINDIFPVGRRSNLVCTKTSGGLCFCFPCIFSSRSLNMYQLQMDICDCSCDQVLTSVASDCRVRACEWDLRV